LLVRYADGSPDFRMGVVVLVVVKHMAMSKMYWRTFMKWHYSPDLWGESRTGICLCQTLVTAETVYGLSCTTPDAVPAMFRGVMELLTAFVVASNMSSWPPWTT
jgi:hypothetical protein